MVLFSQARGTRTANALVRFCLTYSSEMGFMADRTHREFSDEDIAKFQALSRVAQARQQHEDVTKVCKLANIEEIKTQFLSSLRRRYGKKMKKMTVFPLKKNGRADNKLSEQMKEEKD